jgi:hypothetical protein
MKELYRFSHNSDFICMHCRNFVSAGYVVAGVNNRNHCPYCLWSRHLDWRQAGDRLSACKGSMEPVGLTVKKIRQKYGRHNHGELMLVHCCIDCGEIAINRIAADDDSQTALDIFDNSLHLASSIRLALVESGIQVLMRRDRPIVEVQLFGWNKILDPIPA